MAATDVPRTDVAMARRLRAVTVVAATWLAARVHDTGVLLTGSGRRGAPC